MSVSVIIPAYRAARTIGRALDSVLSQTRQPEQIVVVNDGSPDDLGAAVAPYACSRPARVTLINKPNGGVASARNLGIDRSEGDLIAFLDADDYWEPHKLERQLEVLDRDPLIGLVASAYYGQDPGAERVKARVPGDVAVDQSRAAAGGEILDIAAFAWTSTVVLRRQVLGSRRFQSRFEPAEDRDLWAQMAAIAPVYILSEPLATVVFEPASLSRSNIERGYAPLIRVIDAHAHLLSRNDVRRQHARVYRGWASAYLYRRQFREAIQPAWNRVCRQPFCAEAWWVMAKASTLSLLYRSNQDPFCDLAGKATAGAAE